MKSTVSMIFIACMSMAGTAHGEGCKGLPQLQLKSQESPPCGSLATVLDQMRSQKKKGGRKLEEDRPFDMTAAQADLKAARSDPEIKGRIEQLQKGESDETTRMVYEAAILDDEGHYDARDLLIQQLQQRLK